jgi:peptidoglycan/xylan/chitin deacetylase (PgdA/CDA1 family)
MAWLARHVMSALAPVVAAGLLAAGLLFSPIPGHQPPHASAAVPSDAPGDVAGQPIALGDAELFGSTAGLTLAMPVVAMTATPTGLGYWIASRDGGVFAFGDGQFFGSMGGEHLASPVVGIAASPYGKGYWLAAADGGVFAFGSAGFFGSVAATGLHAPIVGIAATTTGHGYWLTAADGGVFAFGDAPYVGSAAQLHLNRPVVGMAHPNAAEGYWLTAADGAVFAYGNAGFYGSAAALRLAAPIVGITGTPDGLGYWLAGADGGIFAYGDAGFFGSAGGQARANPIGAVVSTTDGRGLWLVPTVPAAHSTTGPSLVGVVLHHLSDVPGSAYPPGAKVAALTFDDGPSVPYTSEVLNVLTQYRAPATFEIIGRQGAANPTLLQAEASDGMTLTNHTWDHVDLTRVPPSGWSAEVDQTTQLITSVTGQPVKCLRPPYGATNTGVVNQLAARQLGELMWDIDPSDYLRPPASVLAQRVLSALHPGAIVILHDGGGDRSQTVAALPAIIQGIRAAGYQLVSVCN